MASSERDPLRDQGRVFQPRSLNDGRVAEVDDEIEHHLRCSEEELVAAGMSPAEARAEARRRFGDPEAHRRRLRSRARRRSRRERLSGALDALRESAVGALRALRSAPGTAAVVIVTLALGIGANAVMFGVVDRLLLRAPAGVVDPDSLVRLNVERRNFAGRTVTVDEFTYPDYLQWRDVDQFSGIAAVNDGERELTLGLGEEAERVAARKVTPALFPLLGVRPRLGRFFGDEENVIGAATVAVLGYELWERRFGADPEVLDRTIVLGGERHRIVGVAPPDFTGFDLQRVDVWVPLFSPAGEDNPQEWRDSRGHWFLRTVARLAPGASRDAAAAAASARHQALRADIPEYDAQARVLLDPIIRERGAQRSPVGSVARWLLAVSAIVLIVACANVANVLLARGMQRRRELGVRLALGISGRRLAMDLLAESLLLALLGGAAALLVVRQGAGLVRATLLPEIHWGAALDGRSLIFVFVIAALTGVAASVAPALHARRQDVATVLEGGNRAGGGGRGRFRTSLLVVQTALSMALLIGAGVFVRSLQAVESIDVGFDPRGLLVAFPEIDRQEVSFEERAAFYADAVRRLRAVPGVEGAVGTMAVPFHSAMAVGLVVPDVPEKPDLPTGGPYINVVDDGYFDTVRLPLVEGRGLGVEDGEGAPLVAVVDATMAAAYWPGERAIGRCIKLGEDDPCRTVVGVAASSARDELLPTTVAQYYVPLRQVTAAPSALLVRVAPADVDSMRGVVQREVRGGTEGVRFVKVQPLQELIDPQARSWRLGAMLFSVFGALALTIAAVGLYGVMSFWVARHRHEMGVRAALGASPRSIVRMVLGRSLAVVAGSVVLGALIGLGASPWLQPLLYGVSPRDPAVVAVVAAALLTVALLAVLPPARRAARVDPVLTLRAD